MKSYRRCDSLSFALAASLVFLACPGFGAAALASGSTFAAGTGVTQAALPFGFHPAFSFGVPGDPWRLAREAGVAWTRGTDAPYLFWSLVDPGRTGDPRRMRYSGTVIGPEGETVHFDYDRGVREAAPSGLEVMMNLAVEPELSGFARPGSWLPVDEAAYRNFVVTTVRRYPSVRVWQVGNEPDIQLGFPPAPRLADFSTLQRLTYQAIKEADPKVLVAMGGAADWPGVGRRFFDRVLDELGGCCVDIFDFHLYGDPVGGTLADHPMERIGHRQIEEQAREIRRHLDERGFAATRIWTTENGTFSGTVDWGLSHTRMTASEVEQARDLPKRTVVALASGVEKLFWAFGISEGLGSWQEFDYFDHTGLVYTGHGAPAGTPKLGYWALWQMTHQLEGCDFAEVEEVRLRFRSPGATRAYTCPRADGGTILIAWWDTFAVPGYRDGDTVTLTLPWPEATARLRSALPAAESGAEVEDPTTAFPETVLTPRNGTITLTLGPDPLWVRSE